ncbi:MAG: hypothetical protein ACC612_11365 [Methanomethylovorans sp.]|uniref:hypothetical protein n=1 Tax=Methanomethylovorans sp. TaxID=2758717 RepID=UPI003530A9C3
MSARIARIVERIPQAGGFPATPSKGSDNVLNITNSRDGEKRFSMRIEYRVSLDDLAYRLMCDAKPGEEIPPVKSRKELLCSYRRWLELWGNEWIYNLQCAYDDEEAFNAAHEIAKKEVLKKFPEFA